MQVSWPVGPVACVTRTAYSYKLTTVLSLAWLS